MEAYQGGKEALIASIERDGKHKAEAIINDAKKRAEERERQTDNQIRSILSEARNRAGEQSEREKKKILTGVNLEVKRILLHGKERLTQDIFLWVRKELELLIQHPRYRSVLGGWIVEAMIGLDTEVAQVNASERERGLIDQKLLKEAEEKVKNRTGRSVRLRLSAQPPLRDQGIVVEAVDGRTAFNNQVDARIKRNQQKIRKLIYERLFGQQ